MRKTEKLGVVYILVLAAVLSFGVNYFSPAGISLQGQWDSSKGVVMAVSKQEMGHADMEINNPLRVHQMIKNKAVVLLDARPKDFYDMGHLPGALSFPLETFDEGLDRLLTLVKKESVVLVYCSGVECTDSHAVADQLVALNYKRVHVYAGGFREWQEMGYETEQNEN
jgi:rhodanese-related sulfurtransferase